MIFPSNDNSGSANCGGAKRPRYLPEATTPGNILIVGQGGDWVLSSLCSAIAQYNCDLFLSSGTWNDATNTIDLTMSTGTIISIPIVDQIANFLSVHSFTDGTNSFDVLNNDAITIDSTNNSITATTISGVIDLGVNLDPSVNNKLSITANGLYLGCDSLDGCPLFDLTNGVTPFGVAVGDALTIVGTGIIVDTSVPGTVDLEVKISAEPGNNINIALDGGLYSSIPATTNTLLLDSNGDLISTVNGIATPPLNIVSSTAGNLLSSDSTGLFIDCVSITGCIPATTNTLTVTPAGLLTSTVGGVVASVNLPMMTTYDEQSTLSGGWLNRAQHPASTTTWYQLTDSATTGGSPSSVITYISLYDARELELTFDYQAFSNPYNSNSNVFYYTIALFKNGTFYSEKIIDVGLAKPFEDIDETRYSHIFNIDNVVAGDVYEVRFKVRSWGTVAPFLDNAGFYEIQTNARYFFI